ncbi:MAG TPA: sugar ABC transporter permease, partial [bacterium]|nr:sugar ABC transporter permease [bacterium]
AGRAASDAAAAARRRARARGRHHLVGALAYLLPSLAVFTVFVFYPLWKNVQLSLYETSPLGGLGLFVGAGNYALLLHDPAFLNSLRVTFLFALYTVPAGIVLGLPLAMLANRKIRGVVAYRTAYSFTIAVSIAAAALIWEWLLDPNVGMLNYGLGLVHLPKEGWLTDPRWALPAVAATTVWKDLGFNVVVLLAALQSVPDELTEAARIDGAGQWGVFRNVVIPAISPALFFVGVVATISVLQSFGQVNILTQGGPVEATNVIVYAIYRNAFFNFRFGLAAAQAMLLFVLVLILTAAQFTVFERFVTYQ